MHALTEPSIDAVMQLETDGYALLRGVLPPEEVADLRLTVDEVWRRHRDAPPRRGGEPLHLLAFLNEDPRFLDLLDHPRTLGTIVDVLGPNIFMYHCHLDVHPPENEQPHSWRWHQDGGIQNPGSRDGSPPSALPEGRVLPHGSAESRPRELLGGAGVARAQHPRAGERTTARRPPSRSSPRPATRSCSTAGSGTCAVPTHPTGSARHCSSRTRTDGSGPATISPWMRPSPSA